MSEFFQLAVVVAMYGGVLLFEDFREWGLN
jgi:hypothetical protein